MITVDDLKPIQYLMELGMDGSIITLDWMGENCWSVRLNQVMCLNSKTKQFELEPYPGIVHDAQYARDHGFANINDALLFWNAHREEIEKMVIQR
jgi:hypothetical protein